MKIIKLISETFLFQNRKRFRTFKRKAISEGIFMARSAKKCLPNKSFFRGGPEGVVFAKNTPSGYHKYKSLTPINDY
jgi:hypothetical protein